MDSFNSLEVRDKPSCMRGVGGFCIADSSSVWQEVVDTVTTSVLAAEGSWWLRRIKTVFLSMMSFPGWRRLIPKKQAPISINAHIDVLFQGTHDKWIAFDLQQDIVMRRLATEEFYEREVWVRNLPVVASISPAILSWDASNLAFCEQYVRGRPVQLHDLDEGLGVLRNLWPHLGAVYNVKTREAPLELSSLRGNEVFYGVIHEAGLQEAFMAIQGLPVKQGLVHGDLKHPNVIIGEGQVYVIDWGEQFFLAPPLFDLLYYLYWHTRSVAPEIVLKRALSNGEWIEEGLPGSLGRDAVEASLCVFAGEMVKRLQQERRPKNQLRKLVGFLQAAARQLRSL